MMERIYAYSNKTGKHTVVVAAISLAAVMILNLFVTIPGMTHLAFLMLVCGWITLGYGFFGGILTLMRR